MPDPRPQNIPIRTPDPGETQRLAEAWREGVRKFLSAADYVAAERDAVRREFGIPRTLLDEADGDIYVALVAHDFNVPVTQVTKEQRRIAKERVYQHFAGPFDDLRRQAKMQDFTFGPKVSFSPKKVLGKREDR